MAASANTSSTSNDTPSTLPTFNPSSSINITKLTRTNFQTWKATILPYLKGQKVFGYVDGTIKMPAQQIPLSSTLHNFLCGLDISSHFAFATQSKAKAIQVRSQLATARKTTRQPLKCDEIITYLLAGLGPEYDALVTTVSIKENVTLEEVYSMLLTCDARVQQHHQALLSATPSANVATKQQSFSGSRGRSNNSLFRGRGRGQHSSRGRGDVTSANPVSPHEYDIMPAAASTTEVSNAMPPPAMHAVRPSIADAPLPSTITRKMTTRSQTNSLKPKQPYELPIRLRGCIELRSEDHVEDNAEGAKQAKPQRAEKK
ncbi:hypothetical protein Pint_10758 [Pistacia integerrima]|uniref:Uncharacterized protein n=1 Tax=Pistacia integerrima TaxID=434235 RepID=A0ACC0XHJ8_9ROSI|nr:hypothetical protein Pint_10758 [Pistacia integerrima]